MIYKSLDFFFLVLHLESEYPEWRRCVQGYSQDICIVVGGSPT